LTTAWLASRQIHAAAAVGIVVTRPVYVSTAFIEAILDRANYKQANCNQTTWKESPFNQATVAQPISLSSHPSNFLDILLIF
jgi:hypothetical protein